MTPYKASKIVNALLQEAGVSKSLPPQMFYNYTTARINAGKEPLIACDDEGITEAGLSAWYDKYLAKQVPAATSVDPDQLELTI
jgi:hypothetical protein